MSNQKNNKNNQRPILYLGLAVLIGVIGIFTLNSLTRNTNTSVEDNKPSIQKGGDIIIEKSQITKEAKFFPYQSGETKMEILAVKANDGSIRTAFNTCQICFSSGRGYYKQEGDKLVCQNCGNRFGVDDIELIKGGCNPVPIVKEFKEEDDTKVVIQQEFLKQYEVIFEDWKRN